MQPVRCQEYQDSVLIREWWVDEATGQEIEPPDDVTD
jgi:hypothetical protein